MAKRGNYGTWSADHMEKALKAYNNGEKGLNQCSRDYGICDKYKINATTIFNVDESGFSTVAKKCQKIVARKGSKAVGSIAKKIKCYFLWMVTRLIVKTLAALLLARENRVVLLQLPGHTTHCLQPLDKAFFKPLKTNCTQASERWLRSNPGRAVAQYQVAELLNAADGKAATIETAINAFRSSGVWPVNDSYFVASEVLRPSVNRTKEASRLGNQESSDDDDIPLSILKIQQVVQLPALHL
ncbi:unnamed protein product [Acanthoscelides obtectus]|uniref:DDE-1 domain-containing protein n=1 Tax=Acanthoscelides obtectus TaxID=200917 RepID=A0A9P0VP34_ACAOB|nr:unnamed protein product [Acanthoscelides obtectus]CAK1659690.1 hypothetical protein AOBTE_LOCUS21626 [Acanthoscelides obtectus]